MFLTTPARLSDTLLLLQKKKFRGPPRKGLLIHELSKLLRIAQGAPGENNLHRCPASTAIPSTALNVPESKVLKNRVNFGDQWNQPFIDSKARNEQALSSDVCARQAKRVSIGETTKNGTIRVRLSVPGWDGNLRSHS